jgi:secreted PhoX family phosphatase
VILWGFDVTRREYDDDHLLCNESLQEHFQDVLGRVRHDPARRHLLKSGLGLAALVAAPGTSWSSGLTRLSDQPAGAGLGFTAVSKSLADLVVVPDGYVIKVIHATGDPLFSSVSPYSNQGLETDDWSQRIGDHHDGMDIFYIGADGKYSPTVTNRAVLVVNHESSADAHFFHPNGQTSNGLAGKKFTQFGNWDLGERPGLEVLKEINHHGFSVVELELNADGSISGYKMDAPLNHRVTPQTLAQVTGPEAHIEDIRAFMSTAFDPSGQTVRGTLNNCGHGKTPWGTYLGCEENWAAYFNIPSGEAAPQGKLAQANKRYGLPVKALPEDATKGRSQGWYTVTDMPNDQYRFSRWNLAASGADPMGDFRQEGNTFGYVVEIDPVNLDSPMAKRVALGRMAHEAAVCSMPIPGQPLAFYMGCDARNEYIYKFVSDAVWDPVDIGAGMTAGQKYLTEGKLYVAKFNDDGTGQWIELSIEDPRIKGFERYPFANQADVLVNTRLAADAVGATPMDRPEWGAVNPANGEVYFTLTNNNGKNRDVGTVNAANPRAYLDEDGKKRDGNPNGHILRFREANGSADAAGFQWDIFLFGAEEDMPVDVNVSQLTASNAFSSPDGLWFSPTTGILWIQTDDGAATDESNCMMVAALPGEVGDGGPVTIRNQFNDRQGEQRTFVGALLSEPRLKRFLVGPKGSEITGLTETADGRVLLVNIQHPGELSKGVTDEVLQSTWPSHAGPDQQYGQATRPRSATIAISRVDGGVIGL